MPTTLYVHHDIALYEYFPLKWVGDEPKYPRIVRDDSDEWQIDPATVPEGIKSAYYLKLVNRPEECFDDLIMTRKKIKHPAPDFFKFQGRSIISERGRKIFEEFMPNVHEFYPCKIYNKDKSLIDKNPYFHFIQRLSIFFYPKEKNWPKLESTMPYANTDKLTSLLVFPSAINFILQYPYWEPIGFGLYMREDFFQAVKDAKLDGFELLLNPIARRQPWETVGQITLP